MMAIITSIERRAGERAWDIAHRPPGVPFVGRLLFRSFIQGTPRTHSLATASPSILETGMETQFDANMKAVASSLDL